MITTSLSDSLPSLIPNRNKGGWIRIFGSIFTITLRVHENIGEFNVSMQDVEWTTSAATV